AGAATRPFAGNSIEYGVRLLPGSVLRVCDDWPEGDAYAGVAAVLRRQRLHFRDARLHGSQRLAPGGVDVAVLRRHLSGRAGSAAEVDRHVWLLHRLHVGVATLEAVELAGVIERLRARPHASQHLDVLVRAAVARIMVQEVTVAALLGVAAAGDHVQGNAAAGRVVQGRNRPRGEGGEHKAGPVGDEEPQAPRLVCSVLRDEKPSRRGGGVADECPVEAGVLMGPGELGYPGQVHGAADDVYGGAGAALALRPDHADD